MQKYRFYSSSGNDNSRKNCHPVVLFLLLHCLCKLNFPYIIQMRCGRSMLPKASPVCGGARYRLPSLPLTLLCSLWSTKHWNGNYSSHFTARLLPFTTAGCSAAVHFVLPRFNDDGDNYYYYERWDLRDDMPKRAAWARYIVKRITVCQISREM